jgi:hypothetical protein
MFGGREILSKVILSNVLEVSRMAEKPVAALKRNNDHYPAGLIRLKKMETIELSKFQQFEIALRISAVRYTERLWVRNNLCLEHTFRHP